MSKSRLQVTSDGSHTLYNEGVGETYHSSFGAIQESKHIFITGGLLPALNTNKKHLKILEVGTGTGLNVLLTFQISEKSNHEIEYMGFDPFPPFKNEVHKLNYPELLNIPKEVFYRIHSTVDEEINLSGSFVFTNNRTKIQEAKLKNNYYDVVFFDAFSADTQPELWTPLIFSKVYDSMVWGGLFTTYSCKGIVKRGLKEVGFYIEKIPGPPGKREFLRAIKR